MACGLLPTLCGSPVPAVGNPVPYSHTCDCPSASISHLALPALLQFSGPSPRPQATLSAAPSVGSHRPPVTTVASLSLPVTHLLHPCAGIQQGSKHICSIRCRIDQNRAHLPSATQSFAFLKGAKSWLFLTLAAGQETLPMKQLRDLVLKGAAHGPGIPRPSVGRESGPEKQVT